MELSRELLVPPFFPNIFPFHIPVEVLLSHCTAQRLEIKRNWDRVGGRRDIREPWKVSHCIMNLVVTGGNAEA